AGAFTEGTFYPAFAQDLKRANKSIVILSPFMTGPGVARWVDALRAAVERGVQVRVVTRPAKEFGGGGTAEVAELVRGLRKIGVVVDLRARMHEKIACVDDRILWHGSLNILSHRDTSESMLRLEIPTACLLLSTFLSPPAQGRADGAPGFDIAGNPECPICGGPTVWNNGRYGIWFKCEDPNCEGTIKSSRGGARSSGGRRTGGGRRGGANPEVSPCPEPGCGGVLRKRKGRYGPFLGCSNYPKCRHTERME
ncbi:MAG: hypothetical protein D6717_13180, partial [Gammaproteobacteria bacterium]